MRVFLAISCYSLSLLALAQESTINSTVDSTIDSLVTENPSAKKAVIAEVAGHDSIVDKDKANEIMADDGLNAAVSLDGRAVNNTPEVGKHVMSNMNAGSMILSLLMVLALIIICAFVLKRFNISQQGISQLKVITSLSLGTKERLMVVQVGEQQLLLGVTAQQITLLETLAEPLTKQGINTAALPKNILSFLSAKKS